MSQPRKIFVGSLPDGIPEHTLRAEFSKYGPIEDVCLKAGCEPGRQWAFITYPSPQQAQHAMDMTNGVLTFVGAMRPCEVSIARNQGKFGQQQDATGPPRQITPPPAAVMPPSAYSAPPVQQGPKKIFVGSLPEDISEIVLRAEFSKYGQITDVFIKPSPEHNRTWAFIHFGTCAQASHAQASCDRVLVLPGCDSPCEVTIAKHQGLFGQDGPTAPVPVAAANIQSSYAAPTYAAPTYGARPPAASDAPRKIFVGTLPANTTEEMLRVEFSSFGQIEDIFLKPNCDPGRQWGFITYSSPAQASSAKEATDRILYLPGAEVACEVKLAKNQGKFGQAPATANIQGHRQVGGGPPPGVQPPPPAAPPPTHLTNWRMYKTAAGLPYYHNAQTGVTQWECPPELQLPGQGPYGIARRNAPY